jgi:regulator of protease activity HflC (stomatin/prohibitin superfamily)
MLIVVGCILIASLALFFTCTVSVPAGHTGVVSTFGKVEDYVFGEGLHFKLPWQSVINMDNRTQKETIVTAAFSSDFQQVDIIVSLNFSIDRETSQRLYRDIGASYYKTIVEPKFFDAVKNVFTLYSAEDMISARNELSLNISELLSPEMKAHGIQITSVSVENIDFTDDFTEAVEAKQVAEQNKLKAAIEQEQANLEAEAAANRKVIAAEAEAEVAKIQADAAKYASEQEAMANEKLAQSISEVLIQYFSIEKWDGKLPTIYSGEGEMLPILNINPDTVLETEHTDSKE